MHLNMWFDEIPESSSWAWLWRGYVVCGNCSGIRTLTKPCPACAEPTPSLAPSKLILDDGNEVEVAAAFMGAESRYEDWVFLILLEREWKRSETAGDPFLKIMDPKRPSARAAMVLIFWTYFETKIERLLRQAMSNLPEPISRDFLQRYSSIGSRLDRLYKILFDSSYWTDLQELGYSNIATLLQSVHDRRNRFLHGEPEAIDDAIVSSLGAALKEEHEAWIAVFNKRAAFSADA